MKKIFFSLLALSVLLPLASQAVAIDDSITPQNCDRSDASCASFLDTTSAGQIKWGGLVAAGLRSLTNFFVDGKMGVGTLRPSVGEQALRLDVEGAIGANYYCDADGNHCVAADDLGGETNYSTTTANVTINGGDGLIVNETSNNTFNLSIDPTTIQTRITGVCAAGSAISKVNQDGTVECQSVSSGTVLAGDSLWATSTANALNIYNRLGGYVGIGVTNPQSELDVAGSSKGKAIVKVVDSTYGNYALLGINGNGAEFYGVGVSGGLFAHANGMGENSAGLAAQVDPDGTALDVYGAKLISPQTGAYLKGNVALYATDMNHATDQSVNYSRDNRIPSSLVDSATQYAGYFDGNVNINGDLTITGTAKLNGAAIATVNTYKVGESCGMYTYGVNKNVDIACQGIHIYNSGDRSKSSNYQCPSGFTLAGGDFQSEGNRYLYTCVYTGE